MIIFVCVLLGLLLFPIVLSAYTFFDWEGRKVGFALYLFGVLKVFSGYAAPYSKGLALHFTKNTAILIPYDQMMAARSKFKIAKGFVICRIRQITEIGGAENAGGAIALCMALRKLTDFIFYSVQRKNDVALSGDVLLDMRRTGFRMAGNVLIVFNLLVLFVAAVKLVLERILNYANKRK